MPSLNRIYRTLRALLAELPLGHYLLAIVFTIIATFLLTISDGVEGGAPFGTIAADYLLLDANAISTIIGGAATLAALLLGVDWMVRELKEENRAVRFLSLPLSTGERATTVLIMHWVIIPAITILPAFLVGAGFCILAGDYYLLPPVSALWKIIPLTWVSLIAMSLFWLFPVIRFPRLSVVTAMVLLIGLGLYLGLTRENFVNNVSVAHDFTAFRATDVVGLSAYKTLSDPEVPATVYYSRPDRFGLPGVFLLLTLGLLVAATVLGLSRKNA